MVEILRVLVGSRAHGLHSETSDYDYRGVFVHPTEAVLSIVGDKPKDTSWVEHDPKQAGNTIDDTSWEIGHFLKLSLQCNPTILEVFTAPVVGTPTAEGLELRSVFPYVWDPKRVVDSFVGYGLNQRKKMLEEKDSRPHKYAVAYLRTLIQAERLLTHGVLSVDLKLHAEYQTLMLFRNGMATIGQIVDKCREWQVRVEEAGSHCTHKPNHTAVNDFLLAVRHRYWAR